MSARRYGKDSARYTALEREDILLRTSQGKDSIDLGEDEDLVQKLISEGYVELDTRTPEAVLDSIESLYGGKTFDLDRERRGVPADNLVSSLRTYVDVAKGGSASNVRLDDAIRKAYTFLSGDWSKEMRPQYEETLSSHSRAEKVLFLDKLVSRVHDEYTGSRSNKSEGLQMQQEVGLLLNKLRDE